MATLHTKEIFSNATLAVIVVEEVHIQHNTIESSGWLHGSVQPVAIVVKSQSGSYALDMEANLIEINTLAEMMPELGTL